MAKIDVSKIEGFSEMTADEKVKALEAYNIPDPDYSGYVKKDVYDKAASDLAAMKKKYTEQLSAEDQQKQANEEELNSLRQKVEEMEKEKRIAGHKAKFLTLGYEENLAEETAQAMVSGDVDTVFANQKKFLETHDKAYKAQLMGQTATPPAGVMGAGKQDYTQFIADARAKGDTALEAYYIRLSEEAKQNN